MVQHGVAQGAHVVEAGSVRPVTKVPNSMEAYSREADSILASGRPRPPMDVIGRSREGRPIEALRVGGGRLRVSLLGGCHADEPVGPRFLRRLAGYLASADGASLRRAATWHVVPHVNPDGAARNAPWQRTNASRYDFASYLRHRVRELPGDDVEFGFPRSTGDVGARPENRAAAAWWRTAGPFDLHASFHGMSVAAGPYFLLEPSWWDRFAGAGRRLAGLVRRMGYVLHDVDRRGEKGFHRLAPGFCCRPDSEAMRRHFSARGEFGTADRFRPSSMEAIRALGGDTLTLVTEMPLFLLPGVGETLGPPDPALERWKERIAEWDARIAAADAGRREATGAEGPGRKGRGGGQPCAATRSVSREAAEAGLAPMPVADQMRLQWAFVRAGLAVAGGAR